MRRFGWHECEAPPFLRYFVRAEIKVFIAIIATTAKAVVHFKPKRLSSTIPIFDHTFSLQARARWGIGWAHSNALRRGNAPLTIFIPSFFRNRFRVSSHRSGAIEIARRSKRAAVTVPSFCETPFQVSSYFPV